MTFRSYYRDHAAIEATQERRRLREGHLLTTWRHWGPYVSERQWGTVREWYETRDPRDPARAKDPWTDFVHDQARSRAYRWGEDGIAGISDLQQLLCFSVALWNGEDPILKERLFGLTNPEGNHGEDVKEYYYYLDNTPTHSYMKYLYKYPYAYPYSDLVDRARSVDPMEYELVDTGALDGDRYYDVLVEYAKGSPEDILVRITVTNRGGEARELHVLPTVLFRNTWAWDDAPAPGRPSLSLGAQVGGDACIEASDVIAVDPLTGKDRVLLKARRLYCEGCGEALFTDNDTNAERLGWGANASRWVKDGINDHVVARGQAPTVNPAHTGTKAAAHYTFTLGGKQSRVILLRLTDQVEAAPFSDDFRITFEKRRAEADEFYRAVCPYGRSANPVDEDLCAVQRQAFAGMLWGKQFYHLIPNRWLKGDLARPSPEHQNDWKMQQWHHMYCKDVLSMPDKWEYPWFAAWDLAFHATTLAIIDPEFAKHQLELLLMEWYQHPDGQIPAYEWDFRNINPPVHAWAAWRVYQTENEVYGTRDRLFLERVFEKLHMNFTWWVNQVDDGKNDVFEGGFLGLDNIRILDRDPSGKPIEQADGTAWMAMYCLNMLRIAVELTELHGGADQNAAYQYKDCARKYLQHFMFICDAMNRAGDDGLWDESQGFFMDRARGYGRIPIFSAVGLVPLFAIERIRQRVTAPESFYELYGFLRWFATNRRDLIQDNAHINIDELLKQVSSPDPPEILEGTVAVVDGEKLRRILTRMLSRGEFLSPHGIRGLSKHHLDHREIRLPGASAPMTVAYECAESAEMKRMGGNSNWCGPVWMPINYLIVDSLRKYHRYLGPEYEVECPAGSGTRMTLDRVADELSMRLVKIFLRDPSTRKRPVFGGAEKLQTDPEWKDHLLFYEYFHGGDRDDRYAGAGLGASHQTGWTGLVANLIQELGVRRRAKELGLAEDAGG